MPHFVPIPPDKEYWVPKLTSLSLPAKNGTAAIGVWGVPANSEVRAKNNDVFVSEEYRKTTDLRFFYLRGLKGGDEIAAFDPTGTQVTAWLSIKSVAADHWALQRAAGTLPKSKLKPNISLDPLGAEQRHPPVPESMWLRTVDDTITKINGNPLGKSVLGGLISPITIGTYIQRDQNANSAVIFTPQSFQGETRPGAKADEILFHEFVHLLESNFSGYSNHPTDGLHFDGADFLTVTATNLYASIEHRPLRKDHWGFDPMPAGYAASAASFRAAYTANFNSIKSRLPAYWAVFAASSAAWNPFK